MTPNDEWSPDEPLGTEAFEQGDEATDDASRIDPLLVEDIEQDPSINPTLLVDDRELEEAGAKFDDPERMVSLEGGMDDPDGVGSPTAPGLDERTLKTAGVSMPPWRPRPRRNSTWTSNVSPRPSG